MSQRHPQRRYIHMRAIRPDGLITAACARHVRTKPQDTITGDLVITRDEARVTCPHCRAEEA